ncbi:MAG: type IV pilus twitching motility protein PilT [Deltaproteobacteria bacterium]|nr:type IV pilus twitching motility protein PilT [Deltaproteobacteria bacterium]
MTPDDFDKLLRWAVENKASDVHLKVGSRPLVRIDGTLHPVKMTTLKPEDTNVASRRVLEGRFGKVSPSEIEDLDLPFDLPGVSRFRVNIFRQRGNLTLVLRTIPTTVPDFDELGLPPILAKISDDVRGLILVTGATGSGKSSTLASMIRHINSTRPVHIVTIEDPIEFLHEDIKATVNQREVGTDTESFNKALRASLRQDPDVILVGEIRDYETIDTALKAAETGHLVLSTVHTPDAGKTIGRVLALFPPDEQDLVRQRLADNLRATISQRLLKRSDGKGRVVAVEVMIVTGTVQDWLLEMDKPATIRDIIEKSRSQYGMLTFDQCLTDLYKGGLVTLDVAKASATNPADFVRALHFEE